MESIENIRIDDNYEGDSRPRHRRAEADFQVTAARWSCYAFVFRRRCARLREFWIATTRIALGLVILGVLAGCRQTHGVGRDDLISLVSLAPGAVLIDLDRKKAELTNRRLGINLNFLLDDGVERRPKRPLEAALREMGVGSLRFPGGEDSDGYLWSVPPFSKSVPTLARTGTAEWPANDSRFTFSDRKTLRDTLDFDEFMAIANKVGAEPVLVICYDSMYKPAEDGGTVPDKSQLLKTAAEWVRYANITKGYGVKYWEIGNESYLDSNNGATTAEQYAADLKEFSDAMKAVDPTIKVGANGLGSDWWRVVLSSAAAKIDFLSVHVYPVWGWESYDYYRRRSVNPTDSIADAIEAVNTFAPAQDKKRLRIAVTETNVGDWSPIFTWANDNDLGHALVAFDLFGQLLAIPEIDFIHLWTTRWIDERFPPSVYDALSPANELLPVGRAIAIWGQYSGGQLVAAAGNDPIRAYASYMPAGEGLTIFLVNKETRVQAASISVTPPVTSKVLERWVFRGAGPTDTDPIWERLTDIEFADPTLIDLDPLSITVLSERRRRK